jgi:hypothetical protein
MVSEFSTLMGNLHTAGLQLHNDTHHTTHGLAVIKRDAGALTE